jgi:hypothetical protein
MLTGNAQPTDLVRRKAPEVRLWETGCAVEIFNSRAALVSKNAVWRP